jgi:DNA polymerase III alpha subunit
MTETPPFVPLWCSSAFSFLLGASHPAELVEQAVSLGCAGIALTDRDSLGGVVEAWQTTREQEGREPGGRTADGADLPLIVGAEVTVSRGDPSAAYALEPGAGWFRILLYATSREGYGNISELISRGRLRRPKGESLVTIAEVAELSDDVLLIWNEESGTRADLAALLPAFPGRAWVGISRHFRSRERRTEAVLCAAATKFDLPVVALPGFSITTLPVGRYRTSSRVSVRELSLMTSPMSSCPTPHTPCRRRGRFIRYTVTIRSGLPRRGALPRGACFPWVKSVTAIPARRVPTA